MSKLKVSVENFGPIRRGSFELSPLTVFIGPNNTGKSYLALLLYSLCLAVSSREFHGPYAWPPQRGSIMGGYETLDRLFEDRETLDELRRWLSQLPLSERARIAWGSLPEKVQLRLGEAIDAHSTSIIEAMPEFLRDYFGFEGPHELVKRGPKGDELRVVINRRGRGPALFTTKLAVESSSWDAQWHLPVMRDLAINVLRDRPSRLLLEGESLRLISYVFEQYWSQLMQTVGFPVGNAYYLPAARSGILSGWQAFASIALHMTRQRFGVERLNVPSFTGVTGDFLQILLGMFEGRRRSDPSLASVLEALETRIFEGQVTFAPRRTERPLIIYRSSGAELPIHRASSMVAELAPLSLWVQYAVKPGDLLIIEEPEAHLHPSAQRQVATVLVRLVRSGVKVLCTTHSSLILHQLSNHIIASQAGGDGTQPLGYTEDDRLLVDEIGVYLFQRGREGTQIKRVPVDAEVGIEEEEFIKVMEAIGDETYRLSVQRDVVAG